MATIDHKDPSSSTDAANMASIRTLSEAESDLLKSLYIRMSEEMPTAFSGTVAALQQYSGEFWKNFTSQMAISSKMDGIVAENDEGVCGFVTVAILTEQRLAHFERRGISANVDSLTVTTMLGRMWVAPHMRGQGLGFGYAAAIAPILDMSCHGG